MQWVKVRGDLVIRLDREKVILVLSQNLEELKTTKSFILIDPIEFVGCRVRMNAIGKESFVAQVLLS